MPPGGKTLQGRIFSAGTYMHIKVFLSSSAGHWAWYWQHTRLTFARSTYSVSSKLAVIFSSHGTVIGSAAFFLRNLSIGLQRGPPLWRPMLRFLDIYIMAGVKRTRLKLEISFEGIASCLSLETVENCNETLKVTFNLEFSSSTTAHMRQYRWLVEWIKQPIDPFFTCWK